MAKIELDERFGKFGTVSFANVTQVNDFIGYLEEGRLMGTRCRNCGRYFFPPRADCFESLRSDMDWFEVKGTGKLISYSTLQYAPVGFTEDLPYTIALVDYEDYKVFGRVDRSIPVEDLSVGLAMTTAVIRTPNEQLTYVFQKA